MLKVLELMLTRESFLLSSYVYALEDRFAPFESDTLLPDAIINMEEENAELEDIVKLFGALPF